MEKFKVGDQVRLKKNLKVGKCYGKYEYELLSNMVFEGNREVIEVGTPYSVRLVGSYYYPNEMLVKAKEVKS